MALLVQRPNSAAFAEQLHSAFVANSVPDGSNIDSEIELIKGKAGLLALTMFDAGKKDMSFGPGVTFSTLFSQETYGAGFTKGFSVILAYLICLEEESGEGRSEAVTRFASKVHDIAQNIFGRLSAGDCQLSDVRKSSEQIDNAGGYYQITPLAHETIKQLVPENSLRCPLEIDVYSGHLIAKTSPNLSQQLLDAYRAEIETHLTEDGKRNLKLPYNIGFVAVAYKDELARLPEEVVTSILQSGKQVDLSFKTPYVVPVRGDNRYALVASVLMDSPDITQIRKEMGLGELYSAGRPLRFTFGAVHNPHLQIEDEALDLKVRTCKTLQPVMQFIQR